MMKLHRKGLLALILALTSFFALGLLANRTVGLLCLGSALLAATILSVWTLIENARKPRRPHSGTVPAVVSLLLAAASAAQTVYILIFNRST